MVLGLAGSDQRQAEGFDVVAAGVSLRNAQVVGVQATQMTPSFRSVAAGTSIPRVVANTRQPFSSRSNRELMAWSRPVARAALTAGSTTRAGLVVLDGMVVHEHQVQVGNPRVYPAPATIFPDDLPAGVGMVLTVAALVQAGDVGQFLHCGVLYQGVWVVLPTLTGRGPESASDRPCRRSPRW